MIPVCPISLQAKNGECEGKTRQSFFLADLLMNLRLADGCSDLKDSGCKVEGRGPSGCVGETPNGSTSTVTVRLAVLNPPNTDIDSSSLYP